MNSTLIDIVVWLVILGFGAMGYYLFIQDNASQLGGEDSFAKENLLKKTQVFMSKTATLDTLRLDSSVLEDPLFLSYRSFYVDITSKPVGRQDPFTEPVFDPNSLSF
jgi:hypothetical protein